MDNKIQLAIQAEKERMQDLVLAEDQKKVLIEAANFVAVPFLPQSKEFIQTYMLSNVEFPTLESKLVQALTELQVRMNNLAHQSLELKKAQLKRERLGVEIENLHCSLADKVALKMNDITRRELELEIVGLRYQEAQTQAKMDQIYTELCNWKATIDDIMKSLNITSPHEIDYTKVKMAEMDAKLRIWKQLHTKGMLEMTPSKLQVILSNPEPWNSENPT